MSNRFTNLKVLNEDVDDAFAAFYEQLLEDDHFAVYFEDRAQIDALIQKQKDNFIQSLEMDKNRIIANYTWLGQMHYDLQLPYVDFMKGMEILEDHFLIFVQKKDDNVALMYGIFGFFKLIKSSTARGYLNRMLQEDKQDLELFFENVKSQGDIDNTLVLDRMNWLKRLLEAVEHQESFDSEDLVSQNFTRWIEKLDFLTPQKKRYLEELDGRIVNNTKNLFYFLKKGDYLEILPLYSSLMNVYKLTMMLSSSISFEMTDYIISNLRKDGMTNLMRKESFEQFLIQEIASTERYKMPFCLIYMDLDAFKCVNDTYGHFSGDEVIMYVGKTIGENIRASDIGFRIGGDEFAIILKGANKKNALNVCQAIVDEIAHKTFEVKGDGSFQVSVSCGVFECNSQNLADLTVESVIKGADENLYASKRLGKNKIV